MRKNLKIFSPLSSGNGAYILHEQLQKGINGYRLKELPRLKTVIPSLLVPYAEEADIIHTLPEYGTAFYRSGAKLVLTFHNFFWDKAHRNNSSLLQNIYYQTMQSKFVAAAVDRAHMITAVSDFTAGLIQELYPQTSVRVIFNGVDVDKFSPRDAGQREGTINILFSGNPTKRKGADTLIEIAESLPKNAFLNITGGPRGHKFNINHPNIRLLGHIPHNSMPEVYKRADILLLPSSREGLSLSVLEAMASGLPVVCYNNSSMSELIVDQQGGVLCDSGDVVELKEALLSLVYDQRAAARMGGFNRERVCKEFNKKNMIENYQNLFYSE